MTKIKRTRRGPVLSVTLDRPQAHNAFDHEMVLALRDIFEDVAAAAPVDRPHAVVLEASGKTFCAGGDLDDMRRLGRADLEQNLETALELGDMFRAIKLCPAPVVARVQGDAFGGGVGLICCCDIVVAADHVRLALTEARLGLVAGVISPMVVGRIGAAKARLFCLTGDRIDATEALATGLLDKLASLDDLDAAVDRVVTSILKCGPEALANLKILIDGVEARSFDQSREFAARMIAEARTSPEALSALDAFFKKEPAPWAADLEDWKS